MCSPSYTAPHEVEGVVSLPKIPSLRGPREETPTENYFSFHLKLNAALICFAEVNLRRRNR